MPLPNESPNSIGHVGLSRDSELATELGEFDYNPPSPSEANDFDDIPARALPGANDLGMPVETVYSVDGSRIEVTVGDERRNKRVGFIDIALVKLDLDILDAQARHAFVSPSKVANLGETHHVRMVLPSTNTLLDSESTHDSWRQMTYQNFRSRRVFDTTLFTLYHDLLKRKGRLDSHGRLRLEYCPAPDCEHQQLFVNSSIPDKCPECGVTTYPTDALRVHERVSGSQSNEAALNVLMGIIEHIVLLGAAHDIWMTEPARLERTAFIKDGPLAQFDTGAWIHEPIHNRIGEFKQYLRADGRSPLVYTGIHKTGDFAAYAQSVRDYLDGPTVLPFSNDDIYEYVIAGDRTKDYAYKTYYGKNFLYKSAKGTGTGHILAFLTPRQYVEGDLATKEGDIVQDVDAYDELARTVSVLERILTIQHRDGLIPLVLAHEAASIPEALGRIVLGTLAEAMSEASETET